MIIELKKTEKIIKRYFNILNEINDIPVIYTFKKISLTEEEIELQLNQNIKGKFIVHNIKHKIASLKYIYKINLLGLKGIFTCSSVLKK